MSVMAFKKTTDLVQDPKTVALVDEVAALGSVESSHIGVAGSPSAKFARYEVLRKALSEDQLLSLLLHESPIVRGYVAQDVIHRLPTKALAAYPLLSDTTEIGHLEGCIGGRTTLSAMVESGYRYGSIDLLRTVAEKAKNDPSLKKGLAQTFQDQLATRLREESQQKQK